MRVHGFCLFLGLVAACSSDSSSTTSGGGEGGKGGSTSSTGTSTGTGTGTMIKPPPFDWVGIIGTGQSLSVGDGGTPEISTSQPYKNLKLFDASPDPKYDGVGDDLSLVPLTAPIRPQFPGYPSGPYPSNIFGETYHEAMANQLSATAAALGGLEYTTVHTVVGETAQAMAVIKKDGFGKAYAASLYEAKAILKLAKDAGKKYGIGAIVLTHGEADAEAMDYGQMIHQLWADYNADLPAITGQKGEIPMLVSQQNTFPNQAGSRSASTVAQWKVGVDYPGKILCAGPKYQYGYAADDVHLDAPGYRRLGEKYAEVFARATMLGEAWKPLQPRQLKRDGKTITVDFDVPNPPLAWEESISPPHQVQNTAWAKGRGFEVEDSTGQLTIASVEIEGKAVRIVLAEEPKGQKLVVRYAMTQDVDGFTGGTPDSRRGQLRDSDPFVGRDRQVISSTVKSGSAQINGATGAFATRGLGDIVEGGGLPAGTVVIAKKSDTELTLSKPISVADGNVELTFHHDQRNYCVQFEISE